MLIAIWIAACTPEAPTGDAARAPERPPPVAPTPPSPAPPSEALIVLSAPIEGETTGSTFDVRGTAMVWEGRLNLRLLDAQGRELARQSVSASAAAPAWGEVSARVEVPAGYHGPATLEASYPSARDGSPQGLTRVGILIR